MDKILLGWLLILGIGFPILGILLNEAIEKLEQPHPQLAAAIRKFLRYVFPSLALLLVMRYLLGVSNSQYSSRLVETVAGVSIVFVGVSLVNAVLTTAEKPQRLQIKVPNLFFQVLRALIVLGVGYYLINNIWQVDLGGLATAAGVGSLVIALALQETLSNLVSGFLMLLSRPFKEGDYIEFDDVQGYVVDQDWRSVTLKDRALEKYVTVPNGTLAQATIENHGNLDQEGKWHYITCSFSFDDPPFRVLDLLRDLASGIEHLLTYPKVYPVVESYGESAIHYQIWYKKSPGTSKKHSDSRVNSVSTILHSRIYYLARRENLRIPYPISVEYAVELPDGLPQSIPAQPEDRQSELVQFLGSLSYFTSLSSVEIRQLAAVATFRQYGLGEIIVREGIADDGLYLIFSGSVWSSTSNLHQEIYDLGQLAQNALFGELSLFPGEVSPITVVAREDCQIIVLPITFIRQLIQGDAQSSGNSKFSSEMLLYIDKQKKKLQQVKDIIHEGPPLISTPSVPQM